MPKLKTNSGTKKRFRCTGSGYVHLNTHKRKKLTNKSPKRRRQLRGTSGVNKSDEYSIKRLMGDE